MAIRETFEFENPETGEVVTLNVTSLVSDVRDLFLSKIRNDKAKQIWSKMSENEQRVEIDHAQSMAQQIVNAVASIVATANRPVIHALLDNYKVKGGEVTVTAKGLADDGAVLALNHVGRKALKIIVVDEAQFEEETKPAEPDPDQYTIFNHDKQDEGPSLADAMQAAIEADEAAKGGDAQNGEEQAETPAEQGEEGDAQAEPEKADLTPYEQGRGAAEHGLPVKANPFKPRAEKEEHDLWLDGFNSFTPPYQEPNGPEGTEEEQPETQDAGELAGDAEGFPGDTPAEQFNGTDPYQEGVDARIADEGPDANPYDGGTDGWFKWRDGYDKVDGKIEQLKGEGYKARENGAGPKKNPWKEGTKEFGYWVAGYNQRKSEEQD